MVTDEKHSDETILSVAAAESDNINISINNKSIQKLSDSVVKFWPNYLCGDKIDEYEKYIPKQ